MKFHETKPISKEKICNKTRVQLSKQIIVKPG